MERVGSTAAKAVLVSRTRSAVCVPLLVGEVCVPRLSHLSKHAVRKATAGCYDLNLDASSRCVWTRKTHARTSLAVICSLSLSSSPHIHTHTHLEGSSGLAAGSGVRGEVSEWVSPSLRLARSFSRQSTAFGERPPMFTSAAVGLPQPEDMVHLPFPSLPSFAAYPPSLRSGRFLSRNK